MTDLSLEYQELILSLERIGAFSLLFIIASIMLYLVYVLFFLPFDDDFF